jgi:hypothetical protein
MSLSGFKPETVKIELNREATMTVRGLSADDFSDLLRTHLPAMVLVLHALRSGTGPDDLIMNLIRDAPIFCAHAISCAADEPGAFKQALALPMPITVEAIRQIVKLTFESPGDSGNGFAALLKFAMNVNLKRIESAEAAAA